MIEETKKKAYNRAYYLAHIKERKTYNLAHKKEIAAERRAYYLAHKKEIVDGQKAYRLAHKETKNAKAKLYQQEYPEKVRGWCRKRQALKRGNSHEPYRENYVFERDGWKCQLCGRRINRRLKHPHPYSKSIDHIIPLSKGGSDSPINVQATHLRCNLSKQARGGGQLRLIS